MNQAEKLQYLKDIPASKISWFQTGGAIRKMFYATSVDALSTFVRENQHTKYSVLGACSNTLIGEQGLELAVKLKLFEFAKVKEYMVYAQAGLLTTQLVRFCINQNIGGLEFMATIPGTIGGLVCMNAGAYGTEMKDVLESVQIMDTNGNIHTHAPDYMEYNYRKSSLPTGHIIVGATLKGKREDGGKVQESLNQMQAKRKETQPLGVRSLGCTFKNPKGVSAGMIIEQCGLKGLTVGGARVSIVHGNFIENFNHATSTDFMQLAESVKQKVKEQLKIDLEMEVKVID